MERMLSLGVRMVSMVLWTVAFVAAVGFFLFQIYGRLQWLLTARRDDLRDYGRHTWPKRLKNTLFYAFGQYKFFRDEKTAGLMHVVIFWGFTVLGIQVITTFVRGWVPEFHLPLFGSGILGGPYALMKDVFQLGVLTAVSVGLVRWLVLKPTRLYGFLPAEQKIRDASHGEAVLILCFIATIMLSGFFYDAALAAANPSSVAVQTEMAWAPVTRCIAATFFAGAPATAEWVGNLAWWIHNGVILVFLNLLPRSKHFHIITAIPNIFFGRVEAKGRLPRKDYTKDDALFGRSQSKHFTWKQILDMYSCTECGRCSAVCPATATGKVLAPRQFLLNLRDTVYAEQRKMLAAGNRGAAAALEYATVVGAEGSGAPVLDEVVWSCVSCRACEEACPVNIEYVDKIVDLRQHLVQEASRFPEEMNRTFRGLENNSNPWGIAQDERAAWAEGLDVPLISEKRDAEYLYFVGCAGSYDSKHKKATQSFVKILKAAGVNFAILGKQEQCNGETARRLGNEYLYQTMAESLTQLINSYGVKKILVNCPHCFNTMKNEYPDFGGDWEVLAAGQFVKDLVASGKVKIGKDFRKNVVYHDSCYYGRYNGIYEEARDLIDAVPGTTRTEMDTNRRNGTCCGAGGGRMWLEERKDQRVNVMRTEQALSKNPDVIAVSCPFCRVMLSSGVNEKGLGEKVEVMDVMEIVANNLDAKAPV
jgi:Fe-S oxidoreductase